MGSTYSKPGESQARCCTSPTRLRPRETDFLVKKQHYSGFFDTQLDSLLRGLNVHNIVAVGFESQVCLGTTLTEAMYRNYQVVVLTRRNRDR